jgi:hypothetical protein
MTDSRQEKKNKNKMGKKRKYKLVTLPILPILFPRVLFFFLLFLWYRIEKSFPLIRVGAKWPLLSPCTVFILSYLRQSILHADPFQKKICSKCSKSGQATAEQPLDTPSAPYPSRIWRLRLPELFQTMLACRFVDGCYVFDRDASYVLRDGGIELAQHLVDSLPRVQAIHSSRHLDRSLS